MNKLSRIYRPFHIEKSSKFKTLPAKTKNEEETPSKNFKLLVGYGVIRQSSAGMYHFLPMGQRALDKLIKLVDAHMMAVGAQKITLNTLTKQSLWKTVGTFDRARDDLFVVKDRANATFILSPTHEESITGFLANEQLSYRNLPLLLYQITSKYRDELRPKAGLLRSREFVMKDLYSFDTDEENATKTYQRVNEAYVKIFNKLEIPFLRVVNGPNDDTRMSHEYFYSSEIGDDKLYSCSACKYTYNEAQLEGRDICPGCSKSVQDTGFTNGIEVAHTFNFNNSRYSMPLKATFFDQKQKRNPLHVCSYGIGLSRIIAASIEVLSVEDSIRWPFPIAPYTVCIIPPKDGSHAEKKVESLLPEVYSMLDAIPNLRNDIIIDDRADKTIGKRLLEAKHFGFPFVIVAGKDATADTPLFEVHHIAKDKRYDMSISSLLQYIIENTESLTEEPVKESCSDVG